MKSRLLDVELYRRTCAEGMVTGGPLEAYRIMVMVGQPMTANEVFRRASRYASSPDYRHNMHARLNNLEKFGVVERTGKRRHCTATGVRCMVWRLTGKPAVEPIEQPRIIRRVAHCKCCGAVERVRNA